MQTQYKIILSTFSTSFYFDIIISFRCLQNLQYVYFISWLNNNFIKNCKENLPVFLK